MGIPLLLLELLLQLPVPFVLQLLLPPLELVLVLEGPTLAAGAVVDGLAATGLTPPLPTGATLAGGVAVPPPWATGADVAPPVVPELAAVPSPPLPPPQAASTAAAQESLIQARVLRDADQALACPLTM